MKAIPKKPIVSIESKRVSKSARFMPCPKFLVNDNSSARPARVPVNMRFRRAFHSGLVLAFVVGILLVWLWQPERQLRRHSENLLRAIEHKDWARFASFIGGDYQDQWGNDRALVLQRTREVFRYIRAAQLKTGPATIGSVERQGYWQAKITVDGDNGEVMALMKERINGLGAPFRLEWRRESAKPWDWKLIRVSNPELIIPEYAE